MGRGKKEGKKDAQKVLRRHLGHSLAHPHFQEHPLGRDTSVGVSETGSAKTGSAIDVRIDDAGSILKFRIGFSPLRAGKKKQ